MNLVQIKYVGFLKAYVRDFNSRIKALQKMDKFAKKIIFLGGAQKWVVDILLKLSKLLEDMAGTFNNERVLKKMAPK